MAQFDFSMYPQAQGQQNPLQSLSTMVGIQGQAINNQIAARSATAQQAIGEAAQGATNPDGSFDPNRFMGLVRSDPRAAFEAMAAQKEAQAQRVSQLSVALEKQTQFNSVLGSTLSEATNDDGSFNEDKISPEVITGRVGELVNMGVLDAKTAASELGSMPTDPPGRFAWLKGHLAQGLAAQQQVEAAFGQLVQNDTGAQIVSNRAPVMGPGGIPTIEKQLSPGEAAQPVQGPVTPEGAPTTVPLGQRRKMGQVTVGLSPSQSTAQGVTGGENAKQGIELQREANEAPNLKAILGNMQGDLKYFQTGPGTAEWKHLLSAGINLGLPINQNAVATQENFNKFAAMLAQRTGASLGMNGSDQRFLSAVEANPNQYQSKEANRRIINILKGTVDATATAGKLWQKWQQIPGHGGETFGAFMSELNNRFDPRIFQMQYMNPQERQQMLNGMSPAERQQFQKKLQAAQSRGWVGK